MEQNAVMFRPGRIDRRVEVTWCDEDQLRRMARHVYGKEIDPSVRIGLHMSQVSPASLIGTMHDLSFEQFVEHVKLCHTDNKKDD